MGSLGEDIKVGVKEKKERRLSALSKLIRSKDGKNSSAALEYEHDVKTKEKEKDKKKKYKKSNKKDEQPRGEESDGSAEEADKRRRSNTSKTYKGSPAAPASPSVAPASKKGDTNNDVLQSSGSIRTRHTTSTPNLQVPQPVETRPRASSTAVHRGTYTTYFFFLAQSLTYKKKYV